MGVRCFSSLIIVFRRHSGYLFSLGLGSACVKIQLDPTFSLLMEGFYYLHNRHRAIYTERKVLSFLFLVPGTSFIASASPIFSHVSSLFYSYIFTRFSVSPHSADDFGREAAEFVSGDRPRRCRPAKPP
uniref:Fowl adenovirus 1 DNA (CEL06) n=1 Tax=Fowl adenovirus A serotype 1 (strain CELO / Phelps) TaxID=10553 RepID=Q89454_ADEG1|nr:14.5 kda polypeptide [Fowl aviadenovirus 1]CAA78922.1 unnamed protein product [Fowl aviadenovirus 1]